MSYVADSRGPGFGQEETSAAAWAIESDASAGGGDSVEPSGEGSSGGVGGASQLVVDLNTDGINIIAFPLLLG